MQQTKTMVQNPNKKAVAITTINPKEILDYTQKFTKQLEEVAKSQGMALTGEQKQYAIPILSNFVKKVSEEEYNVNKINATNFLEQVKSYSRIGLSISEKEIWLDFRNNGKTNLMDVIISKQYQGIQKEMVKFCTKPIVRFLDGVVCDKDVFKTELDFETGLEKIITHKKVEKNRNDLSKITSAYAIAYCFENGRLVPYATIIDKSRILRGFEASPSKTKTVWKKDTERMVIKTAYWCLFYDMKPFINIPAEIKEDWEKTTEQMFWEEEDNKVYDIDEETEEENETETETESIEDVETDVDSASEEDPFSEPTQENDEIETGALICDFCGKKITSKKSIDFYSSHPKAKVRCYECFTAGKK